VYDKPMIYYPLSVRMLAGIRDILIITTPEDQFVFQRLLVNGNCNGDDCGINLNYDIHPSHDGLAKAFMLGENFIGENQLCFVLGNNTFSGQGFRPVLVETLPSPSVRPFRISGQITTLQWCN
jgi:glucose-1-phosphate thymidylyltransferase